MSKRVINREEYPMVTDWNGYVNTHSKLSCKCQDCGEQVLKTIKSLDLYGHCWCRTCERKHANEKIRETYSTDMDTIMKKVNKTNQEKRGVDFPTQSTAVREKVNNTKEERYGDSHYNNMEKNKKTKEERYGDSNYTNVEKIRETCRKRYGVQNVFQSDEHKEKMKQTCRERYDSDYWCLSEEYANTVKSIRISKKNIDFYDKLIGDKSIEFSLGATSYDIRFNKTLIEINPTYTHNNLYGYKLREENKKPKNYHLNKSLIAHENGYKCIHVFDWDNSSKIIDSLNSTPIKIGARKCELINEVPNEESVLFLAKHHLQDSCLGQQIRIGLKYNGNLVGLMTFGKPRYNKNYDFELLRLCYDFNYQIIGGTSKMFKYFLEHYLWKSVISYCDFGKFDGKVYEELGFTKINDPSPSLHWFNSRKTMKLEDKVIDISFKQHITDNYLRQRGFDQLFGATFGKGTSNYDLMIQHGYLPVYDAGQFTFAYEKKQGSSD
jgi:hypothetical protein